MIVETVATGRCPACGAEAVPVEDRVLGETTLVLRCGCWGGKDVRLDKAKVRPEPEPCRDCGAMTEVRFLPALHKWLQAWTCDCEEKRLVGEREERQERGRQIQIAANYRLAEVPERFAGATLDNFEGVEGTADALPLVHAYAANLAENLKAGRGLWLIGGVGSGKTHLATGLLRMALEVGWPGHFLVCRDYMRRLKASYGEGEDPLPAEAAYPVLVLDDLGSVRMDRNPEHVREALLDLVDRRYLAVRPTIVTSNLTVKEIAAEVDGRIASRLMEMCTRAVLKCEDYRRRKP